MFHMHVRTQIGIPGVLGEEGRLKAEWVPPF